MTAPAFVLIHGGWHDHSVWDKVAPLLKASGFTALTLDLPGAGANARQLESSHSPFFSQPTKLAQVLAEIGTRDGARRHEQRGI